MGMVCCAAERQPTRIEIVIDDGLEIKWSDDKIFSIEGYKALEDFECDSIYKNEYEIKSSLLLSKSSLQKFFR